MLNSATCCDVEEDVPPLEDCSDELAAAQRSNVFCPAKNALTDEAIDESASERLASLCLTNRLSPNDNSKLPTAAVSKNNPNEANRKGDFGGFKKGFLDRKSKRVKSPETITVSKTAEKSSNMSQMTNEINSLLQSTKSEWLNDSLLDSVSNDDDLRLMQNVEFQSVIQEFSANPEAAMLKYRDNKTIMRFFNKMSKLMGQHMTQLGSSKQSIPGDGDGSARDVKTKSEEFTLAEVDPIQEKVNMALSNPEMVAILKDEEVIRFIDKLKDSPQQAHSFLRDASPEFKRKVDCLVKSGILGIQ